MRELRMGTLFNSRPKLHAGGGIGGATLRPIFYLPGRIQNAHGNIFANAIFARITTPVVTFKHPTTIRSATWVWRLEQLPCAVRPGRETRRLLAHKSMMKMMEAPP